VVGATGIEPVTPSMSTGKIDFSLTFLVILGSGLKYHSIRVICNN
jgi:hypothetical protein